MAQEAAHHHPDSRRNLSAGELDLAARLRAHRLAAGLSRQDLADRAGLSERSVRDIENGRRKRVQDKTLMLLAEALSCEPADLGVLPDVPPAAVRRRRTRWAIALGTVVLAALAILTWQIAVAHAEWEIVDGDLVMRDALLKRTIWRIHQDVRVRTAADTPWDDGTMIVGFYNAAEDGCQAWRVRRATGKRITSYAIDEAPVRAAFGGDVLAESDGFGCAEIRFLEYDGDAGREVLIRYTHNQYYPGAVAVYEADGTPLAQYVNRGHISTLLINDIDADGRDELLALGTNNDPAYQGATAIYLEEGAWSGAAVDPPGGPGRGPVGDITDGARYRLILPAFDAPVMALIEKVRIRAFSPRIHTAADSSLRIVVNAGHPSTGGVIVFCDDRLRPIRAIASDTLWGYVNGWPEPFGQPGEFPTDAWLDSWLENARWSSLDSEEITRGTAPPSG